MNVTEALLGPLRSTAPARPLITHYDDDAQTRVELSTATLANWAAKTANWLVEEFDVEAGDPVCVRLPAHWQTAGVLLGAFWCGAHIVAEPAGARAVFVAAGQQLDRGPNAIVALDPMGRGLAGLREPPGSSDLDYLAEARVAGDDFTPLGPVPDDSPALLQLSTTEVVTAAREHAASAGLGADSRVLSTVDWTLPDGLIRGLLAPLAAGASVVQITAADPAKLEARRSAERTTVDLLA
ncbi:MAG: TIGR03089 family protein [Thermocrispum sp.]